jgi:hypothetical protein
VNDGRIDSSLLKNSESALPACEHEFHWVRWGFVIAGMAAMIALFYCGENLRGKNAWKRYENEVAGRGHKLEWEAFIPAPVPDDQNIFTAPQMSAWFVGRGGNSLSGRLSAGRDDFLRQRDTNWLLEVTFVPLDAPRAAPEEADLVLQYQDSVLTLASDAEKQPRVSKPAIIAQITVDDAPLCDVIRNLATQTGLQYTIDPQSGLGESGGPSVSLRWVDITARSALLALLDQYGLAMDLDLERNFARIVKRDPSGPGVCTTSDAAKQLAQLVRTIAASLPTDVRGPSANGVQGATVFVTSPPRPKPGRVIVRSERVPEAWEVERFFSKKVAGYVQPSGKMHAESDETNRFHIHVSPSRFTAAADYLAWSDQFEPDFNLIREGLKRPLARMNGNYQQPANIPIPNFVFVRILVQTLAQRVQCHLLLGQSENALSELTLIHDVCRVLPGPPCGKPTTLVAAMINVAVTGLYLGVVEDGLRLDAWREPELAEIQKQLQEIELLPLLAAGFEAERASVCRILETATPQQVDQLFGGSGSTSLWDRLKDPRYLVLAAAPRGWIYQNMMTVARHEEKVIDAFDLSRGRILPRKVDALGAENISGWPRFSAYAFLADLVPNSARAIQTTAKNQILVNECMVACALERYLLANGQYPHELESLKPQFLKAIPSDVISGGPLKFRLTPDGQVVLYSVGWSGNDNGGVADTKDPTNFSFAKGDWVWPYREKLFK